MDEKQVFEEYPDFRGKCKGMRNKEKIFSTEEFNDYIRNINYDVPLISYATNTIMIDFKNSDGGHIYSFWIDPAWRIVFNDRILINSFNYPYHENYTEQEQEQEDVDFNNWCSKTDFMKYVEIKNIQVLKSCDLIIEWKNGAELNKFMNDIDDVEYVFYDHIKGKRYYFRYGNIKQVPL